MSRVRVFEYANYFYLQSYSLECLTSIIIFQQSMTNAIDLIEYLKFTYGRNLKSVDLRKLKIQKKNVNQLAYPKSWQVI